MNSSTVAPASRFSNRADTGSLLSVKSHAPLTLPGYSARPPGHLRPIRHVLTSSLSVANFFHRLLSIVEVVYASLSAIGLLFLSTGHCCRRPRPAILAAASRTSNLPGHHVGDEPGAVLLEEFDLALGADYGGVRVLLRLLGQGCLRWQLYAVPLMGKAMSIPSDTSLD